MSITLSPKYGVNPTIPVCFFCLEPKNQVVLLGRMKDDAQAPVHPILDREPCDKCREFMTQGIICISVRDGESRKGNRNPLRSGHFVVIKEKAMERLVGKDHSIMKARVCFIEDSTWKAMGLPTEEQT